MHIVEAFDGSQSSWSPDGQQFVFTRIFHHGEAADILCTMNVDGTDIHVVARWGLDPRWSPCGQKILCSKIGRLIILDAKKEYIAEHDQKNILELSNKSVLMGKFAWSPNGKKVAYITNDSAVYVVNAEGSGELCLIADKQRIRTHVTWAPDNQRLIVESRNGIELFDLASETYEILFPFGEAVAWNPTNPIIAFYVNSSDQIPTSTRAGAIYLYNSHDRKLEIIELPKGEITPRILNSFVWSPNGQFLAFPFIRTKVFGIGREAGIYLLHLQSHKIIRILEGLQASDSAIAWNPDSSKLAVCLAPDFHTHIIDIAF